MRDPFSLRVGVAPLPARGRAAAPAAPSRSSTPAGSRPPAACPRPPRPPASSGGDRLGLDRPPDDDAEVDDRDLEDHQHEDDLPGHGASVYAIDPRRRRRGAGRARPLRVGAVRRRAPARRRPGPNVVTVASPSTLDRDDDERPEPDVERIDPRPALRRRAPPARHTQGHRRASAPRRNALRARMPTLPSPPITVSASACATSGHPATTSSGRASDRSATTSPRPTTHSREQDRPRRRASDVPGRQGRAGRRFGGHA